MGQPAMHGRNVVRDILVNILSRQLFRQQQYGTLHARRFFAAVPETLYDVLGVAKTASKPVIKAAFRKVATGHAFVTKS